MPKWSKLSRDKVYAGRGILRKMLPSRVWYFHFRDERGVWRWRSTRHRDKRGALLWASGMSLKLTRAEFGLPDPVPPRADGRIDGALDEWLEYQRTQNTPNTHSSYRSIVATFRKFLGTRRCMSRLSDITTETMLEFRQWCLDRGNDRVTVDNKLIALRSFFNWCKGTGRIAANPASQQRYGVRLLFGEESSRKVTYTEAEYAKIRVAPGTFSLDEGVRAHPWGTPAPQVSPKPPSLGFFPLTGSGGQRERCITDCPDQAAALRFGPVT